MTHDVLFWMRGKRVAVTVVNSPSELRGEFKMGKDDWPVVRVGHVMVNANYIVTMREVGDEPF